MKRVIAALFLLTLMVEGGYATAAAAKNSPAGYPPQSPSVPSAAAPSTAMPDYLGLDAIPLTEREKRALRLSGDWSGRGPAPFMSSSGKLMYVHGASQPTILASPMQVCDVELQPGETVNEVVVGDSARWMVETGTAGAGGDQTTHLFIKPVDAGIATTAVVTTDRRVYHLRLVSQRENHTPYIGFTYADDLRRQLTARKAQEQKDKQWNSADIDGQSVDLSKLNFNYQVKGSASWKPERVYDDGRQTFIRLPAKTKTGEMPVLLVRKGSQNVMVNYRVKDQTMVVDGLFDKIALIVGVGMGRDEITVVREKKS